MLMFKHNKQKKTIKGCGLMPITTSVAIWKHAVGDS